MGAAEARTAAVAGEATTIRRTKLLSWRRRCSGKQATTLLMAVLLLAENGSPPTRRPACADNHSATASRSDRRTRGSGA